MVYFYIWISKYCCVILFGKMEIMVKNVADHQKILNYFNVNKFKKNSFFIWLRLQSVFYINNQSMYSNYTGANGMRHFGKLRRGLQCCKRYIMIVSESNEFWTLVSTQNFTVFLVNLHKSVISEENSLKFTSL